MLTSAFCGKESPPRSGYIPLVEEVTNTKNYVTVKAWSYSADFKVKAVKLSFQSNIQV